MIQIEIVNEQIIKDITEKEKTLIEQVLEQTAKIEELQNGEVVVTLVDNDRIHELNRYYRGIDQPTDVLSFAMNEQGEDEMEIFYDDDIEDVPNMLGDIVISIPRAIEQAEDYGHTFARELGFLAVHGFLHLLGYDHNNEDEEKEMFAKQETILKQLNLLR